MANDQSVQVKLFTKDKKHYSTLDFTGLYLMPRLHSFLHHHTSRQPWGLVEVQPVQELLPNHLHRLSETLLVKNMCTNVRDFWQISVILIKNLLRPCKRHTCMWLRGGAAVSLNFKRRWRRWKCLKFFQLPQRVLEFSRSVNHHRLSNIF